MVVHTAEFAASRKNGKITPSAAHRPRSCLHIDIFQSIRIGWNSRATPSRRGTGSAACSGRDCFLRESIRERLSIDSGVSPPARRDRSITTVPAVPAPADPSHILQLRSLSIAAISSEPHSFRSSNCPTSACTGIPSPSFFRQLAVLKRLQVQNHSGNKPTFGRSRLRMTIRCVPISVAPHPVHAMK